MVPTMAQVWFLRRQAEEVMEGQAGALAVDPASKATRSKKTFLSLR